MGLLRKLALAAAALSMAALPAVAQDDFIAGIPRNEALIIQGPTAQNADWFNLWVAGGGANVNGNQQLSTDTLWWINPEGGADAWHECARHRAADLQRRLHPDDGQAPRGRLLERRRRVHRRRRGLHRPDPDRSSRHGLERAVHGQRREHRGARPQHGRLQPQAGRTRASTRSSRCAGTRPGSCPSTSSRRSTIR